MEISAVCGIAIGCMLAGAVIGIAFGHWLDVIKDHGECNVVNVEVLDRRVKELEGKNEMLEELAKDLQSRIEAAAVALYPTTAVCGSD